MAQENSMAPWPTRPARGRLRAWPLLRFSTSLPAAIWPALFPSRGLTPVVPRRVPSGSAARSAGLLHRSAARNLHAEGSVGSEWSEWARRRRRACASPLALLPSQARVREYLGLVLGVVVSAGDTVGCRVRYTMYGQIIPAQDIDEQSMVILTGMARE